MNNALTIRIRNAGLTPTAYHAVVKPLSRMQIVTLLKK